MSEREVVSPEVYKPSNMKPIKRTEVNGNHVHSTGSATNDTNNNINATNGITSDTKTEKKQANSSTLGSSVNATETAGSLGNGNDAVRSKSTGITTDNEINNEKCLLTDLMKILAGNNINDNDKRKIFETMKIERLRLLTFELFSQKWPHKEIKPDELAKAGFYFVCVGDRVKCAFCNGELERWSSNDIPLLEHIRAYPNCPFMLDYSVGNLPIDNGTNAVSDFLKHYGRDICGNHELPTLQINGSSSGYSSPSENSSGSESPSSSPPLTPRSSMSTSPVSSSPSNDLLMNPLKEPKGENLNDLGVRPYRVAKNPNYVSFDARLKTFENKWNSKLKATPAKLAEAGFFHVGINDYVKCCYCDGGLCEWSEDDDPWVEHATWFPDCDFVLLNKGLAFIERCQDISRQRVLDYKSANSSANDDERSINAVNEWFNGDLVKGLPKSGEYDEDLIKAALHKRWVDKQEPFAHLGELVTAISEVRSVPRLLSANVSDDEGIENDRNRKDSETSNSPVPSPPSSLKGEERLHCKICLDREVGVLFLPCGHVVACTQCAPGFETCPICRKKIKGIVRTFFS